MLVTHLFSGEGGPGLETVREHFPQRDGIRPHITRGRELQVVDTLWRTPAKQPSSDNDI